MTLRKHNYTEVDLFSSTGRYGAWNMRSLAILAVGSIVGWGFVTNTFASWLGWQGYFIGAIGGKQGPWAYSNVGVIFALAIGYFGHFIFGRKRIRQQESSESFADLPL